MAQKGLLVKKNAKVVLKPVFAGGTSNDVSTFKSRLEGLNPSITFSYEEYDDTNSAFITPTIDETEKATLVLE